MVLLLLISILGICLFVNQIKFVEPAESPLLACCAIIIYVYIFALTGLLNAGVYSAIFIGILAIPYVLIMNRKDLAGYFKSLFEPGFILFILFLIGLYLVCRPIVTGAWDEFSHWALIVRNMMLTGGLPKAGGAIRFINYPPATAVLQYVFIKFTNGPEGMMYYAQAVFMAACISLLLKGQSFKKPFYLILALLLPVLITIKFSLHNIFNIFTDSIMALVAVAGFASYYASKRKWTDIVKLTPIIFVLCLIRINAALFAAFIILLVMVDQIRQGKKRKTIFTGLATMLLPIALALGSWLMHLKLMGVHGKALSIFPIDWPLFGTVAHNFAVALCFQSVGNANPLLTRFTTSLAMCAMGGVLLAIIYFTMRKDKEILKEFNSMSVVFIACFILYCIGMIGAYQFAFTSVEARQVAGFNRYLGSYFTFAVAGIGYMMVSLLSAEQVGKRSKRIIAALAVLIILAMAGLSHPSSLNAIGGRRLEWVYEQEAKTCANQIQGVVGKEAKVYMIFQKSRGYTFMGTRYQLGSNPTNLGSWSFGLPYSEADTWTVNWTPEKLEEVLITQNYEYVYIGSGDEQLWDGYGSLFDKPDQGYIIYKVNPGKSPLLTAIG